MSVSQFVLRTAVRTPVVGPLVGLYRHVAFDLPRLTTATGVGLLLGIEAIRLYWMSVSDEPTYLGVYYVVLAVVASAAVLAMLAARWLPVVRAGWALGSLVALASLVMYIVGRTLALPGLPQLAGRWDYAPGTFAMALSGAFLATHFAVLTRMSVAYPTHQRWRVR